VRSIAALCALTLGVVGSLHGGGFQINEQSARATAMAGTAAASMGDPTAMNVNPAVLSFLEGTHLSFGATVIVPDYRFTGVTPEKMTTKMNPQALFPPNIYLTYSPGGGIAFGFSAVIPFAVKTEWDPAWVGRRVATKSELQTVFLAPTFSFEPVSSLSIGVALNLVSSKLLLSRRIGFEPLSEAEGIATYEGDTRFDYGFQLGMLYRPSSALSVGLAYRSRVSVNVPNGSATFIDVPPAASSSFPQTQASTSLSTPQSIHVGLGIHGGDIITLQGELQYVLWSTFDSLPISFSNPAVPSVVFPEKWKDAYAARLGLEIVLEGVSLRGGILYDQSPIPDAYVRPSAPDANRVGYSVGFGSVVGENLHMDVALLYYHLVERTVNDSKIEYMPGKLFNGSYSGSSTVFSVNISYNWN